ncbi:MAG: AMP-binding protein [Candidatus Latescibacteria bacterium]|nr:AMP-binding protein [Candidatus Latescibacterota bacterium]NIM21838.1 AMP-binding protein [Candidatus Latescibacterota bacterium]NIM66209.1 AMP-binding protein [Candidatus Latescibacterota bacterium]NIO02733.1 AMP-binding protein [Candidatus Latescibacterota bacterium]NIO29275.1 AMP-binding protein [Candidatus Latescibacterota bacterium]
MALSEETLERIRHARDLADVPHDNRLVEFKNIGELLLTRASELGGEEFLVYLPDSGERQAFTYDEFYRRVCQTANFLKRCGIEKGERIATVSQNHYDTVIQYFAAWLIGAVVVPLNASEDEQRMKYILNNSETVLIFSRNPYLEKIQSIRPGLPLLREVVVTGEKAPGFLHFEEAWEEAEEYFSANVPLPNDESFIVYTSGTTGHPKGVVLSQYNLMVDSMNIAQWHKMAKGERMMCVLPLHHVNGTVVTIITPLYYGGSVALNEKFHTDQFFPHLASEQVAVVSVVPTLLSFLLQGKVSTEDLDLSNFRHIICGAGPLTVDLAKSFQDYYRMRIIHGYGLSETTCYSCFLPPDLSESEHRSWMEDYGFPSIGVAIPANEMDIHGSNGQPAGEQERGEIVIRGHNVMLNYYRNDEANTDTFAHGWFRSGDEGFFQTGSDGRRYYFITGRIKELIIRGGVNVSPLEVDEVLMSISGVKAGVAVGFENNVYGEEVGAYVVLMPGVELTEEGIIDACREALPHHKCPKVVVFGEEIPVTSTGKYQRNKLKPLFSAYRDTQFRDERHKR